MSDGGVASGGSGAAGTNASGSPFGSAGTNPSAGSFGSAGEATGGAGQAGSGGVAGLGGASGMGGAAGLGGAAGMAGAICNGIENVGTDVKGKSAAGPFPSVGPPNTPVDGVYVLKSSVWYANLAPNETYRKRTLVFSGSSLQTVTSEDFGPDVRANFTIAPSGFLHQTPICGKEEDWVSTTDIAYTFTPYHTLDIREVNGGVKWPNRIDTYQLVP